MDLIESQPFLRVPPFPGARAVGLIGAPQTGLASRGSNRADLIVNIRRSKVGGDYWAKQPDLPERPYTLVRLRDPAEAACHLPSADAMLVWSEKPSTLSSLPHISGTCDPWHLVRSATRVVVEADDELALVAAIAGVPLSTVGEGRFSGLSGQCAETLERAVERHLVDGIAYLDPFTGEQIDVRAAVRLCAFWRDLIDSNRDISAALGFAFWKRPTVAPLLWAGGEVPFASDLKRVLPGPVAVWKSRTPDQTLEALGRDGVKLIEVEDGFIRSVGLGSDCVPPLSVVVDRLGVHFDPSRPSELERLLQDASFDPVTIARARDLRQMIVKSGISKYGAESVRLRRRGPNRRHVLVPGQVADDRAVLCGSGPVASNLDLLRRAREQEPEAYILYKPHPDVEAGHRAGAIPDSDCLEVADEIVRDVPISALIDLVDELHVNTSLAGFEALLRSKPVTTYGVPFYAGWGLTRDLGPVPGRRTTRRSLDELVAAVLLVYPRYLDPVSGLPCPPEVLVRRISEGASNRRSGAVVQLRRFQGRLKKRLSGLGS